MGLRCWLLSPPVQVAWWAHMRHFLDLTEIGEKIHISGTIAV